MEEREKMIKNYVEGYNAFDVSKMITDFSNDVVFENIQSGEITMTLNGIDAFKNQAETAKQYFSERQQKIQSFIHDISKCEIEIEYYGVLAIDFPNGMKKGQELKLKGKSIFEFKEGKIVKLTDIS